MCFFFLREFPSEDGLTIMKRMIVMMMNCETGASFEVPNF